MTTLKPYKPEKIIEREKKYMEIIRIKLPGFKHSERKRGNKQHINNKIQHPSSDTYLNHTAKITSLNTFFHSLC